VFSRSELTLFHPIAYKGDAVGTVYIVSDHGGIVLASGALWGDCRGSVRGDRLPHCPGVVARLQRWWSDPILRLVQTPGRWRGQGLFDPRGRHSQDEIGN